MKRSPMNRATPGALAWARKNRSALARVGKRGKQRKAAWEKANAVHLAAHPDCQFWEHADAADLETFPFPMPHNGRLDVHHVVPRGMGGGRDYGVYATLCRSHHDWVEKNRRVAKRIGLLLAPRDLRGEAVDDRP